MMWISIVLASLATTSDIMKGGDHRAILVGVGMLRLFEILLLTTILTRARTERWIIVAAVSGVCVTIGSGLVLGGLRHEFALAQLIDSCLCIAVAAFIPWGWRMQLIPVATAALSVIATLLRYGSDSIAPQTIVQTACCLAVSIYFAVDHERLWRSLAYYNADIDSSHRQIATLNRELEGRVAARELVLETANRRLDQFCQSVATDLRPKLAAIGEHLIALEETPASNVSAISAGLVKRVRNASARMEGTLDALLDFVALAGAPLHPARVDISKEADAQIRRLREIEPGRSVDVAIQDGICVTADSKLLATALQHLIDNAWKFSGTRDVATIEVGARKAADGQPQYFVRDNGVGFDMAHAGNLFKPFMRLEAVESFPGHGMGLARAARIIARHGGTLQAHATVGKGAEFRFTLGLPRAAGAAAG